MKHKAAHDALSGQLARLRDLHASEKQEAAATLLSEQNRLAGETALGEARITMVHNALRTGVLRERDEMRAQLEDALVHVQCGLFLVQFYLGTLS